MLKIKDTWLCCMDCGHKADLLKERKFRCPKCSGLYDIVHDFSTRGDRDNAFDTSAFDDRTMEALSWSYNSSVRSGVWRFKEWIMPYLPEEAIVTLGEGIVPIIKAGRNLRKWIGGDIDLYIIMEGANPTGSFKDFGGTVMMSVAKAAGVKTIVCASTGDTSAMAAAYATAADIKCSVILPKGLVTRVQMTQPLVHGAEIITVPGDFDVCMRIVQELVEEYGAYPANSLNPTRIEGHQATVFQIAQYFDWELPCWIAVPIGNGSNCSSIGKALRLMQEFGFESTSRILGCQSEAADPLSISWKQDCSLETWGKAYKPIVTGKTTATAARIGNPVSYKKVMREVVCSNGAMQIAPEEELNEAVSVCGLDGYFVCPQTGIALAGVRNAVRKGMIKDDERVVVVSTATGLKFSESFSRGSVVTVSDCQTKRIADILEL